jgi:hypothetical protein
MLSVILRDQNYGQHASKGKVEGPLFEETGRPATSRIQTCALGEIEGTYLMTDRPSSEHPALALTMRNHN